MHHRHGIFARELPRKFDYREDGVSSNISCGDSTRGAALQAMTDDISLSTTDKSAAIAGGIAGLIPFVISTASTSSVTENGQVVSFTYRDNIAINAGVIAILCGIVAAATAAKNKSGRTRLAIGIAVIALGAFQIARGFGVFASP